MRKISLDDARAAARGIVNARIELFQNLLVCIDEAPSDENEENALRILERQRNLSRKEGDVMKELFHNHNQHADGSPCAQDGLPDKLKQLLVGTIMQELMGEKPKKPTSDFMLPDRGTNLGLN